MEWRTDNLRNGIIDHPARFKCVVAGRRWGKTHLALMWLLDGLIQSEERRWFIAPTYRQGKTLVLPMLRNLERNVPSATLNESELTLKFDNGAEVSVKGAENEDALRGSGLVKVSIDEYAYMKPHVWEEIIFPMLTDTGGKAMFIGTPDGFNHFYDIYLKGIDDSGEWQSWQYTTVDGGFVDPEEVLKARATMDERLFRQEFEASFETAGKRCAYNFDRSIHLKKAKDISTKRFWGVDFNVDYMTAVLACEYSDSTIHYFNEIRLANSNTDELAQEMRNVCPDVPCYPDPAGSARSTTSSKSDHQILRDYKFRIISRKAHPSHRDRLNALNRKLKNAEGKVGMTIDPTCKYLIKDLELCQRDKHGGIDKTTLALTHALDACSYLVEHRYPVTRRVATSTSW